MRNLLLRFLKDDSGSLAVEYLMAAALIATSLLALLPHLGAAVSGTLANANSFMGGVIACK